VRRRAVPDRPTKRMDLPPVLVWGIKAAALKNSITTVDYSQIKRAVEATTAKRPRRNRCSLSWAWFYEWAFLVIVVW
jgi:hypothetical protein